MDKSEPQSYEFKLSLLGHEIFGVELRSSSTTDRWAAITIISTFCALTLLGAYGEKFISFYKLMTGP
jgi:hypothetical protein